MFKVEFIGNLGADAEIKEANGSKFVTMRIALSERWKTESGETKERTTWADATMSNVEHGVIPYLKSGVKVFVRGNASLRVYSSPKDRMMKAGIQCAISEIELVGGVSELVPKQIIEPETGALVDVTKYYWCNATTKGMKKEDHRELIDAKGNVYVMDNRGFVAPAPKQEEQGDAAQSGEEQGQANSQ